MSAPPPPLATIVSDELSSFSFIPSDNKTLIMNDDVDPIFLDDTLFKDTHLDPPMPMLPTIFEFFEEELAEVITEEPYMLHYELPPFNAPVRARTRMAKRMNENLPLLVSTSKRAKKKKKEGPPSRRYCRQCGVQDTPQWRTGPAGSKTLCNACGVRFQKGTLYPEYRPTNSAEFKVEGFSNRTKNIMEIRMRRMLEREKAGMGIGWI